MVTSSSPTVLRRYVALELRRLREGAGFKRQQVAERLRCVPSHISHLETMRNLPKAAELEVLLGFYGVAERTAAFLELVDAARKGRDWWLPFKGAAPEWFDLYLGMESSAVQIDSYDSMVVPGLFQTPAYAKAVIRAGEPELADAEVALRIELRMTRQDVLLRQPDPPAVWSVLDESVLHRPAGEPQVLLEQLDHLVKLLELPMLTIQVLPLEVGVHAGIEGTFMILTFPPELVGDPGIAYVESRIGATYYEDPVEIMTYRNTLRRIQIQARTPEESQTLLVRRIEELR
ncbi:MAG: helix-turn-helix domain-containing protein [Pseudonocardiales bacterium]|nr:helix-turn-helix domain-containing protein [Pseudonocardiales bacterium]